VSSARQGPRPGPRRCRGDHGVAGILVLCLAVVLACCGAVLSALAAVAVARHRAAGVADLAALAGAQRVLSGPAAACQAAARTADSGGGRLRACTVTGDLVEVAAEVRPAGPLGAFGTAVSRARAGPAGPAAPHPASGLVLLRPAVGSAGS
jgi:secretion/DNA translocation related TadE-like protein